MQARWIVLVATLLLAAPVAAQGSASVELTQKDVTSSVEVTGGESVDVPLAVNLTAEGFSCSEEIELEVNVTAEPSLPSSAPENASLSVQNATKTFPIPAGPHTTEAYTAEANATVSAEAASGLQENATGTLTVESSFPGANYSSCLPMEFPPASSSPAEVQVDLIADDPPEPETDEDETDEPADNGTAEGNDTTEPAGNGSSANESGDEESGVPIPWQATPLGAILAALLLRRNPAGS